LLVPALVERRLAGRNVRDAKQDDIIAVRHKCVFTTHTPVRAMTSFTSTWSARCWVKTERPLFSP
jgi:hypothetical protein